MLSFNNRPYRKLTITEFKRNIKFTIFGKSNTGKTAFLNRIVNNIFIEEYDSTIENLYKTIFSFDGEEILIELLDTSGSEKYLVPLLGNWVSFSNFIILIYSIDDRSSFNMINEFYNKINEKYNDALCILVGNKLDLDYKREVFYDEGLELAESWGCYFIETSCLKDINIKEAFVFILNSALKEEDNCEINKSYKSNKSNEEKEGIVDDSIVNKDYINNSEIIQNNNEKESFSRRCCSII